jgi:hypothetical protein
MAVDAAFAEQIDAARMLNQTILSRTGVALPVVDLDVAASAPNLALVITFGSFATNRMLGRLAGDTADELAWRAAKNRGWIAHHRIDGTDWLSLIAADPENWGSAVARFGAMLQEHHGRLAVE